MSATDSSMQWYVARDGRQHGPISDMEMRKLVELGHLRPADLIWRAGFADWRPAHTVFSSAPPAPTPSIPTTAPSQQRASIAPRFEATGGRAAQPTISAAQQAVQTAAAQQAAQVAMAQQQQNTVRTQPTQPVQTQPTAQPMFQQPIFQHINQNQPVTQPVSQQPQPQTQPIFQPVLQERQVLTGEIAAPQMQPVAPQPMSASRPNFEPRFEAAPRREQTQSQPEADFDDDEAPRGRGLRRFAIAASVAMLIGGGGYGAYKSGLGPDTLNGLKDKAISYAKANLGGPTGPASAPSEPAPVQQAAVEGVAASAPETTTAAVAPATAAITGAAPDVAKSLEAKLQQHTHWQLIATEFPDWYRERVMGGAKLLSEDKPEAEVSQYLAKSLVELRRSNADAALAASPETLKKMAGNFQGLVSRMGQEGAPTCMTFISSGEANPAVVDMANNPAKNAEINAHFSSIFAAISEGRKTPVQHAAPADGDYKLLVAQLVKLGWTQAELELFADPKGSSRTTPERYCKMMQDFFQAHLSLPDAAVQERLLHRTLKLVVAG
jgi:hypothetical protein